MNIGGIGPTGEDGFGQGLEGGQGVCVGLTNVCPSGWGRGTALQLTAQGPFTEPDHLGDLTFVLSGPSVQVAGDFAPNPAPCTWVQICNDEQMVASACVAGTRLFSLGSSTCSKEVDYLKVNDQSSGFSVLLDAATLIQVTGGMQATGERIQIFPDFVLGERRSGVERHQALSQRRPLRRRSRVPHRRGGLAARLPPSRSPRTPATSISSARPTSS